MKATVVLLSLFLSVAFVFASEDFVFRDGDKVVFLGDSLTAARGYTKFVEHYTLMRFPDRKVRFWNAGKGGDTSAGCADRLERDVFSHGATVVTLAVGLNDIGWGVLADKDHKQKYLDGIRRVVETCQKHHVRVVICSGAITNEVPDKSESGFFQNMCDEGLELARSLGAQTIDLLRPMREVQRRVIAFNEKTKDEKGRVTLHLADGVHLSDLGHLAMGWAMLKGLHAPADVSEAVIDATESKSLSVSGCKVSDIRVSDHGVTFTRLDSGLPVNRGTFSVFDYRFIPVPEDLNRYRLVVKNLPPGKYDLLADGRKFGEATAAQVASGLNIASLTANGWEPGGPWDSQSCIVKELVEARDKVWWGTRIDELFLPGRADLRKHLEKLDDEIVEAQRAAAAPRRYRFEIRRQEKD